MSRPASPRPLLPALLAAVLLSACGSGDGGTPATGTDAPAVDTAEATSAADAQIADAAPAPADAGTATTDPSQRIMPRGCNADTPQVQAIVGKRMDDALLVQAEADSGAQHSRVVGPEDAVDMAFEPERLDIDVDAAGVVVRVRCG